MTISLEIMGFITKDDYIDNTVDTVNTVYELSDNSLTFSKQRKTYYWTKDSTYGLQVFYSKSIDVNTLVATEAVPTQQQADYVFESLTKFIQIASSYNYLSKAQIIQYAIDNINYNNSLFTVTSLNYTETQLVNSIRIPNKIIIEINNTYLYTIWCSDFIFQNDYPHYEINIVTIDDTFGSHLNDSNYIVNLINSFNLVDFNTRIEANKGTHPTTYTRILNIPYKVPNTTIFKDCYFGFNIYGKDGDYIDVLKNELLAYLVQASGLTESQVIALFPSIAEINEFFIVPRWDRQAIPSQVGQDAIYSHVVPTYLTTIDLTKFIKVYTPTHFNANSYNVPMTYNNLLGVVVNGQFTEPQYKDFLNYYGDILTITSTSQDFGRMQTKTQHFITVSNYLLSLSDKNDILELYNEVTHLNSQQNQYTFKVRSRNNIHYVVCRYDKHTIYCLPKFEFFANNV
jgi:hypothetical protein